MSKSSPRFPDISAILKRKAEGRRQRAALGFAEKLDILDALKQRFAVLEKTRNLRSRDKGSTTAES